MQIVFQYQGFPGERERVEGEGGGIIISKGMTIKMGMVHSYVRTYVE